MMLFFADDSRVNRPSRAQMHPLLAVGGVGVEHSHLKSLESALAALCREAGFPDDQVAGEFKWSPKRNRHWMYDNLTGNDRMTFFQRVLEIANRNEVKALVVIEDNVCNFANANSQNHEHDVTTLFLERIQLELANANKDGIVVTDRYSGDRDNEDKFVESCIEIIQQGTNFVQFSNIAISVLCCPSKFIRIIQLADLVTGCTSSYFGGERQFSPQLFEHIKPLLYRSGPFIGGYGVKIHPDFSYGNLYHWLLGDTHLRGSLLPINLRRYFADPGVPQPVDAAAPN